MSDEPRRWLDSEIPAELRQVLRSAEDDHAQHTQLANLQAKLEQTLGPSFGGDASAGHEMQPPAGAASSGAATGGGSALSGALAIAAVLMVGLGAYWYGGRAEKTQPARVQNATVALPVVAQITPPAIIEPQVTQPSAAMPKVAAPAPRPARQVAQGGGLVEELKQLEAIRRRLPAQPAKALTAIAQHARRFPQGALGPERELLRIEALQRLGRRDEAQRAADRALAPEAGHPYAVQIRQLMASDAPAP